MSDKANILWTNATWNFVTGCSKRTAGCKNCYAQRDWGRLARNEKTVYFGRKFTDVMYHPERLDQPLRWRKPRRIFTNSMSDLFHEHLNWSVIDDAFAMMALCEATMSIPHVFQVLTKREERMHEYMNSPETKTRVFKRMHELAEKYIPKLAKKGISEPAWPLSSVWLGVTVENQEAAEARLPYLLSSPAAVRWISSEPLLDYLDLTAVKNKNGTFNALTGGLGLPKLDWVIVGGESGPNARVMSYKMAKQVKDHCVLYGTPFVFKQWGTFAPDRQNTNAQMVLVPFGYDAVPELDGQLWEAYPKTLESVDLQISI